jgi:hypothetical protein
MKKPVIVALAVTATITAVVFGTETRLNHREMRCGSGSPPPEWIEKMAPMIGRDAASLARPTHNWCVPHE